MSDETRYSLFANEAYNYGLQTGDTLNFADDFKVVAVADNFTTGYHGFAAYSEASCTLTINSAGSDGVMDFFIDLYVLPFGANPQHADVVKLSEIAQQAVSGTTGCTTISLVSTGHSLGGEDTAYNVKVNGGTGYAYNAPGQYGLFGSVLNLIGIQAVGNVHYVDSEIDGILNWVVTALGQRSAEPHVTGLLGGTLTPAVITYVKDAIGHGMQQLVENMIDPLGARDDPNSAQNLGRNWTADYAAYS